MNPAAEPVDRYDFYRYHPGFWKPITSLAWGLRVVSYHADHETAAGGEDGALLARCSPPVSRRSITGTSFINQADMLREKGMGNYRDLLVALAKNPAMIYWLDNCDNHGHAVNENWGRELLELFSLGAGYGWASQLHGDRRPGGLPGLHRLDHRAARRAATITGGTGNLEYPR